MGERRDWKRGGIVLAAAVLLAAAAVPAGVRAAHWASWRVAESDRPLVERALGEGAAALGMRPDDYRRLTSPAVRRLPDRTCVDLASLYREGAGSYFACYDARTGRVLSERSVVCAFGAVPLTDRVRAFVMGV